MKKTFAIIYFIALTASYSANASQCPYQPTRSIQILAVIKKDGSKSVNKVSNKNNVVVTQKAVNPSSQTQQIEESETLIEDVKKEEKISPSAEKLVTETNSTDNKINSEQRVQEVAPAQEQGATEMNLANGADLNEKLEEEKKYKTDSVSEMKTQGHYIGFDMLHNKLSFYEKNSSPIDGVVEEQKLRPSSSGYGVGFGFGYKYALNFNDFFIAPGIFLERTSTHVNGETGTYFNDPVAANNMSLRVKGRYGVKVDVGYDINKVVSPYLVGGYSMVNYISENGFCYISENGFCVAGVNSQSVLKKGTAGGFLYGVGMKINHDKRLSFNIEFNEQSFQTENDITPLNNGYTAVYDATLRTLKLGVLYNF
jgi:opacity protein-like surface antigen